ncbi:MAG TPA: GMC family oxidoreductase [Nocardioides bacterium]|uniref:GMC family oxidoreductase n=1 Tax=uncultured Nocardioides sp. TaxID=198441 RepID=UPI000EE34CB4|nr:GMC family oxidoreductase [uncultured Nocardioides sp.]HCB02705.1 GMC family oxidoreductase [Nocardioides sp.]
MESPRIEGRVDVLVVGAGPGGAVATHTLATAGLSVVCLEQGDWVDPGDLPGTKPEFELLTRGEWSVWPNERRGVADYPLNVDDADVDPIMYNAVGGGSVMFGGHWMRLLPSDFRVRTLDGVADDWPIGYDDLEPFHQEVDRFIGVSGLAGDPAYPDHDYPLPPHPIGPGGVHLAKGMNKLGWHWWPGTNAIPSSAFKNMGQCVRWGLCERGCPVGAKASFDLAYWPHATAAGARLITGARVARITVDHQGLASGAVWIDRSGTEHRIEANAVVLAGNGIGTPRILLMSDDRHPDGLANSSGLVGKNLMVHPVTHAFGLYHEELEAWNGPAGQLLYTLEFAETDRSRGFVRGTKWALMPPLGALHVLEQLRRRPFDERWGSQVHDIARHLGRTMTWSANIDDLPEESNTVTLDPLRTDSSGLPGAKISYRMSENTRRMIEFTDDRMVEAHEAAGAVRVIRGEMTESGHLLGTARMGNDPRTSVVDRWGRAHDVPNLFIVDGSVMVTGGSVNPTANIAALSLRTARHIVETARDQAVPA